jgi:uncharacterized Zn-binding protein involved in type VI secretion
MPQVHRYSDRNDADAEITKVLQNSVYANNLLVSVDGSNVAPHGKKAHVIAFTENGSKNVYIENKGINRVGDKDTCGHERHKPYSPNVFVN